MHELLKITVLPALLTLVVVASSLMGLMSHLSRKSFETTYKVKILQQAGPCQFCHAGPLVQTSPRLAHIRFTARPGMN